MNRTKQKVQSNISHWIRVHNREKCYKSRAWDLCTIIPSSTMQALVIRCRAYCRSIAGTSFPSLLVTHSHRYIVHAGLYSSLFRRQEGRTQARARRILWTLCYSIEYIVYYVQGADKGGAGFAVVLDLETLWQAQHSETQRPCISVAPSNLRLRTV